MKKTILSMFALALLFGCKNKENSSTDSAQVKAETTREDSDWEYLFDGKDAEGWRGYNEEGNLPEGWVVENGTLKSLGKGGDIGGDIVYGKEKFGEFELSLEWKISTGGNSGIFYHIVEGDQYKAPYFTAPEYQVIDQLDFPKKLKPWQSVGADYAMHNPQIDNKEIKKAGEWNSSRIRFTNEKVTYWLNGNKTVEFVPWTQDWENRKAKGKWKDFPDYGNARTGLIGLQDHGSEIWYRNIKIKKL